MEHNEFRGEIEASPDALGASETDTDEAQKGSVPGEREGTERGVVSTVANAAGSMVGHGL